MVLVAVQQNGQALAYASKKMQENVQALFCCCCVVCVCVVGGVGACMSGQQMWVRVRVCVCVFCPLNPLFCLCFLSHETKGRHCRCRAIAQRSAVPPLECAQNRFRKYRSKAESQSINHSRVSPRYASPDLRNNRSVAMRLVPA